MAFVWLDDINAVADIRHHCQPPGDVDKAFIFMCQHDLEAMRDSVTIDPHHRGL